MTPPSSSLPFRPRKVLVVDAGGSHIKLMISGSEARIKFDSGPGFTPRQLIAGIRKFTPEGWEYDAVSLGLPTPVINDHPVREPKNLGRGWLRFDFQMALGKPCRIVNDAAMQALGSYQGGRMLFLGLGTGLGAAMILDDVVIPLELSNLHYDRQWTIEDMLGRDGRKRLGQKRWEEALEAIVANLLDAFVTDYVIIGGGNARKLGRVPEGARIGDNRHAYLGGLRLWGLSPRRGGPKGQPLLIR